MALASNLYGHMMRGSLRVKLGQTLKKGDEIGYIGNTGDSTGPHCHFTRIPGRRDTHWSGNMTVGLGGTRADIYKFLDASPLIKNKLGLRPYDVSCGWMGYEEHGAVDFHGPDRTSIAGESMLIWNQDYPGRVIGIYDFGDGPWHKTGVTVIILSGYAEDLPKPSTDAAETYVVVSGDDLYSIAQKHSTTVSELVSLNGIANPSLIHPGQEIRIGKTSASNYTVKSGDTLSEIAEKFGTTYQVLAAVNRISDPSLIYPGHLLTIPGSKGQHTDAIQIGSNVKVQLGAKTYDGGGLADFVYRTVYSVIELSGDRAVIGVDGRVTAAVDTKDLSKA